LQFVAGTIDAAEQHQAIRHRIEGERRLLAGHEFGRQAGQLLPELRIDDVHPAIIEELAAGIASADDKQPVRRRLQHGDMAATGWRRIGRGARAPARTG